MFLAYDSSDILLLLSKLTIYLLTLFIYTSMLKYLYTTFHIVLQNIIQWNKNMILCSYMSLAPASFQSITFFFKGTQFNMCKLKTWKIFMDKCHFSKQIYIHYVHSVKGYRFTSLALLHTWSRFKITCVAINQI